MPGLFHVLHFVVDYGMSLGASDFIIHRIALHGLKAGFNDQTL